jgi:hypothetical protein
LSSWVAIIGAFTGYISPPPLSINIPTCGGLAHAPENSSNRDVATTVDNMLAGKERLVETRWIDDEGRMMARFENLVCDEAEVLLAPPPGSSSLLSADLTR